MPSSMVVKVDRQGRLVLPLHWREEVTSTPGEVVVTQTEEGLLITPLPSEGVVTVGDDGLPLLRLRRTVTNSQVLAAIDAERVTR